MSARFALFISILVNGLFGFNLIDARREYVAIERDFLQLEYDVASNVPLEHLDWWTPSPELRNSAVKE